MGHAPSWYVLLKAARYLRVAPWELAERPVWWQEIALAAESAEEAAKRHRRPGKPGAGVSTAP